MKACLGSPCLRCSVAPGSRAVCGVKLRRGGGGGAGAVGDRIKEQSPPKISSVAVTCDSSFTRRRVEGGAKGGRGGGRGKTTGLRYNH